METMKYIKMFNLVTGESRHVTTYECFKSYIEVESKDAFKTAKEKPYLGTVKDGSRLKYAQELDYILNNLLKECEDWQTPILSYCTKHIEELNDFYPNLPIEYCRCRCIGLRMADSFCINTIERINKFAFLKIKTNQKEK